MPDHGPADTGEPKRRGDIATRFQPGQSGNPGGRPAGARSSLYAELDAAAAAALPEVIAAVVTKAKEGDPRAAELLFRRAWPERKGRPLPFPIPDAAGLEGAAQATAAVVAALAEGRFTPDEAHAVSIVLETHRRTIVDADLERRVRAIEEGKHINQESQT